MIRTRFAPSPTGFLHIGNLRSAVYPYAMARHNGGQFILRIEDTDQERAVPGGVDAIKNTLTKFGLNWDEYYVQSERKKDGIYQKSAEKLLSSGHAFYCQCAAKNAKAEGFSVVLRDPCRDKGFTSGAVKLKVPDNETISYHDFVLDKDVSWDTNTVYDATLLKSDGFPTYHLAAMTDDLDMQISHIVRGHDWMPSTPIHLLVFKYLGGNKPEIGHLTDILSPKGGKLSKRRDSVFCETFLSDGYLPEALLNFVILLGWAPKDNREMYSLSEFVAAFDPKGFQKSNPLFHAEKLDWFNGQYIRKNTDTELVQLVKPFMKNKIEDTKLTQIIPLVKDRLTKLAEIDSQTILFLEKPKVDLSLFNDPSSSLQHLSSTIDRLSSITDWSKDSIELGWTDDIKVKGWKVGDYFMSLRIAIFGSRQTPPVTDSMLVLGKEETLNRIQSAVNLLKG
jgi:glutamyl-tRNA synthetase